MSAPPFRPGEAEFVRLGEKGNLIPVCREIPGDLLTPVAAFCRLGPGTRHRFLLESVEGGETMARYSFLGRDPFWVLRGWQNRALLEESGKLRRLIEDPLAALKSLAARFHPAMVPGLPPFAGGAVGYLAYDLIRLREKIPAAARDDRGLPDMIFGFYDTLLAFDHLRQRILLLTMVRTEEGGRSLRSRYRDACRRLVEMERRIVDGREPRSRPPALRSGSRPRESRPRSQFLSAVGRARRAIRAGEIFQVVLSRRFEQRCPGSPFAVYRALRRLNPSPYHFYLESPEVTLAGASPEMLARVQGRRIETHPIAGTRPRGADDRQDRAREEDLRGDPKERAEHLMLVDLGRNDLGRVCRVNSVRVTRFMEVERYSHVMHLVSRLEGTLLSDVSPVDALMASFPAGTVSGAPKVRAMELIDDLESVKRGPYAGAVGYLDFSGNLDTCIAIRTAVMTGKTAYLQAGAGIVADSTPERESRECLSKAQVLFAAVEESGRIRR